MSNTTNKTRARMDAATITTTAAAVLAKYRTIGKIKTTAASLRDKYGPDNWRDIFRACQNMRQDTINAAAKAVRERVFSYRAILVAAFKALAADPDFKRLCAFAKSTYKGTDTDAAARLVRDFAPAVDAETGAPLVLVRYASKGGSMILTAYQPRELTDTAALAVLKSALNGLAAASRKAARTGKDTTAAAGADNKRTPGVFVAAYRAVTDAAGLVSIGAPLTGDKASKAASDAKAVKAAAGLIGKAVTGEYTPVSTINASRRAAHIKAAEKALADQRAALAADAAAAGMKTSPAPKRAPRQRKPGPLAGDAFIAANKAAAAADAVTLNA